MSNPKATTRNSWVRKFRCAFRGAKLGVRGQSSFFVHFFAAAAVVAAALALGVTLVEWCILLACISAVLTAEMINSAIERLAQVRAFAFDKTGTLTEARLELGDVAALENVPPETLLQTAATAEQRSEHPLAGNPRNRLRAPDVL